MEASDNKTLSTRNKNKILVAMLILGILGALVMGKQLYAIEQFNKAVIVNSKVNNDMFKFQAKFANAYRFAKNGRYQDASQLFGQLMEMPATPTQISAVQYNLGNIFLKRGLMVSYNANADGTSKVNDEAEYLINQAKMAYQQSLRLNNQFIDARYNLDRVLRLLPSNSIAKNDQDELGIVMGNIPSGLP